MATNVTQSTFLSQYNDDYRDSDHYHRILFNSGRALQARELTQMQTIIQAEIKRIAGYLFKEAGIFGTSFGSINTGVNAIGYVKVNSLPTGYSQLIGLELTGTSPATGVSGIVKAVIPATGGDPDTIMVKYTSSGGGTSSNTKAGPKIFSEEDVLSYNDGSGFSGTLTVQTDAPATGKGTFVEVPSYNSFVSGHLIFVESQSLVVSKYSSTPTTVVGFKLNEQIITASDNIALYDNAGATPNLTSPGADRYKISLTLTTKDDIAAGETFFPMYDIRNGVAVALQSADNAMNELGEILASRTKDITGDFVMTNGPLGDFDLTISADSDTDFLNYKVSGGTAFVGGHKIERSSPTVIRTPAPRRNPQDLLTKTNEFVSAEFGNYFVANTAAGLVNLIPSFGSIGLYNATNIGGSQIGTARIRAMDEFDNQFRIHVFDIDMDSNGSGTDYTIGQVRSIGNTAGSAYANLAAVEGRYDVYSKEMNSLLFPLPRQRVNSVSSVTMAVGKTFTATASGTSATFNAGTDTFTDPEQWIVMNNSSGALISPPTVTSGYSTSATVTGLSNGVSYTLYAYVNVTATQKTKTLQTNQTETVSVDGNGTFKLTKADIYQFISVEDDTTGDDITQRFNLDNGQRDDFYTVGSGTLKRGQSAPAGTITVTYSYFQHSVPSSTTGFFAAKASYPNLAYELIPNYKTRAGVTYRLSDVIDMRPLKDNLGDDFAGTPSRVEPIPRNTDTITIGTVTYWQPRTDIITLSRDNKINVRSSNASRNRRDPQVPLSEMSLHSISLNPYVLSTTDLTTYTFDNRGYRMKDIRAVDNRLENIEELTALTIAELSAADRDVKDPSDPTLTRSPQGITGDTFKYNNQSDITDDDFRAMLNKKNELIAPLNYKRMLPLYYDSAESSYTKIKGGEIWPTYSSDNVMIDQSVASRIINVASFEPSKTKGTGELTPNTDTWVIRKKVDVNYQIPENSATATLNTKIVPSQGDQTQWEG